MSGRYIHKYGQHFLSSTRVIGEIIDAAEVLRAEHLVEIGPGQGALTGELIRRGYTHFTVIEIDPEMVQFLERHLPAAAQIRLMGGDFLKFDLNILPTVPTQFISNLPYIDAAAILDKVLAWPYFKTAVFMFQKEQAQKITAHPGEKTYGALSVLSQLRARISLVCNVGRGCFNPPPQVESRVLAFQKITPPTHWPEVAKLVQTAFLHRRKTLLNALTLGGYDKEQVLQALKQLSLQITVRPEVLTPQQFVELTAVLNLT
ncbi:MAG: ribosomal RNA small subunit methyltransferase A [Elusimicrobiaceae bacterium]|nr:ribosomal RNA small subunit methyltransferase A [Elusimicrobiaceae bacterium]